MNAMPCHAECHAPRQDFDPYKKHFGYFGYFGYVRFRLPGLPSSPIIICSGRAVHRVRRTYFQYARSLGLAS